MQGEFKDHYAPFGASPETAQDDLKKTYFDRVRQFHPDKRPGTAQDGLGAKVTAQLNEAWEIFRDPEKRKAYDEEWRQHQEVKLTPAQKGEKFRSEGNALFKQAKAAEAASNGNFAAVQQAMRLYQEAIGKYTEGIEMTPHDHRLRSNRALCYSALKDWGRCREDAQMVTQLRADFMKGWFLLVKAHLKEGSVAAAQRELDVALQIIPGCPELLALQEEVSGEWGERTGALGATRGREGSKLPPVPPGRNVSPRNVSPACTPTTPRSRSRATTPTRTPSQPRVATPPPIPSATGGTQQSSSSRSPGPAKPQNYRAKSRSPGPSFEHTAKFGGTTHIHEQTSGFGDVTSNFGSTGATGAPGSAPQENMNTGPSNAPVSGANLGPGMAAGQHGFNGTVPPPPPPRGQNAPPPNGEPQIGKTVPPGMYRKDSTQWHDDHTPPRRRVGPSLSALAKGGRTFADQTIRANDTIT